MAVELPTMIGKWNKKTNLEIWKRLDQAIARFNHQINWQWVRGHNGNVENERADQLANEAIVK